MPYRIVERLQPVRKHPWLGYAVGLAIFALGFLLRYLPGGVLDAVPFITLFPAILIAALVGGLSVGIVVAVLSFVAGWYFFLPPYNSFAIKTPQGVWALVFFWITVAIQLFIVEALYRAVRTLSLERDRAAVLFQELQHRVANNMAFVASLLRLQQKAVTVHPEDAVPLLKQAQARFETMARIHRRLYDPAIVDLPMATYFEGLVRDILDASGSENIVSHVDVPAEKLDLARLVSLSLLVNELITNSVKHGFAGRTGGTITVRLKRMGPDYVLSVEDDGRGAKDLDGKTDSLGMTVIHSLASQLGGEITWSGKEGTTAILTFPA
jgi:two-component sensor histidine kinase